VHPSNAAQNINCFCMAERVRITGLFKQMTYLLSSFHLVFLIGEALSGCPKKTWYIHTLAYSITDLAYILVGGAGSSDG
jgi:hypothetical protein